MQTSSTAPTFTDTDDPQAMRTCVLTAVADEVLAVHARHLAAIATAATLDMADADDAPLDVSPAAALAAMIDEAGAYWMVETSHGPYTVADYREIAAGMWRYAADATSYVVATGIATARRAAGLRYG